MKNDITAVTKGAKAENYSVSKISRVLETEYNPNGHDVEKNAGVITVKLSGYTVLIFEGVQALNPANDNVDVELRFESGERFSATFFTLENIKQLMAQYKTTQECLFGLYFYTTDLIIIETLTIDTILKVIADLVISGDYRLALKQLDQLEL